MYTYLEARVIIEERNRLWKKFEEKNSDPFKEAKETNLTNSNHIMMDGMFVAEGTTGVYLYPPGLMATSHIPEEAFVSIQLLEEPVWSVVSKLIDYSDF